MTVECLYVRTRTNGFGRSWRTLRGGWRTPSPGWLKWRRRNNIGSSLKRSADCWVKLFKTYLGVIYHGMILYDFITEVSD